MNKDDSVLNNNEELFLDLNTCYHVGKGGAWGAFDFWTSVLESISAGILFIPLSIAVNVLSNKIFETLKSSKAEKDEFQSCRYDLLIPTKNNSWIIVRIMRSAKFRTKQIIEEKDIYNAITSAINKINKLFENDSNKTFLVTAELTNISDKINMKLSIIIDFDLDSFPAIKQQINSTKVNKRNRIRFKNNKTIT